MRTTIDLPEGLLRTAKALAENRGQTMSRVIADLVERGLRPDPVVYATRNGFPILPSLPDAKPYTLEHIKELEDLEFEEKARETGR